MATDGSDRGNPITLTGKLSRPPILYGKFSQRDKDWAGELVLEIETPPMTPGGKALVVEKDLGKLPVHWSALEVFQSIGDGDKLKLTFIPRGENQAGRLLSLENLTRGVRFWDPTMLLTRALRDVPGR